MSSEPIHEAYSFVCLRCGGIVSLRHLLTARRVDLHEEHHAERVLTFGRRRPAVTAAS